MEKVRVKDEEAIKDYLIEAVEGKKFLHLKGDWKCVYRTKSRGETGWDLIFERNKGRDAFVVETKFVDGPRAASFEPAVISILLRKDPKSISKRKLQPTLSGFTWFFKCFLSSG